MKKIKKILLIGGLGLIVLLLIITILVGVNLGRIVKRGVETVAPQITKTTVTLDAVNISLMTGSAGVKNLIVGNPQGYQATNAITIGDASVSISPASLLSNKIVIHSVKVDAPEITFEGNPLGANNLKQLLDNVNGTPKNSPAATTTPSGKPAKKLEVDDFILTGAKVHVQLTGIVNKQLDLTLPDIELSNLGTGPDGITAVDLTQQVLQKVIDTTIKTVAESATKLTPDSINNGVNKLQNGIKGLFGK